MLEFSRRVVEAILSRACWPNGRLMDGDSSECWRLMTRGSLLSLLPLISRVTVVPLNTWVGIDAFSLRANVSCMRLRAAALGCLCEFPERQEPWPHEPGSRYVSPDRNGAPVNYYTSALTCQQCIRPSAAAARRSGTAFRASAASRNDPDAA